MRQLTSFALATAIAVPSLAATSATPDAVEVRTRYICASGVALDVLYRKPTQLALVNVAGREEMVLYQTPVADGFRYIGGENELRGKGDTVSYKVFPDAKVDCLVKPPVPTPGILTGTVSYRQRIALTPGTVVRVELRDVSLADAPAPLIAATTINPVRNQVPLAWRLSFDPKLIQAGRRYAVSARFTDAAGKLRWITDTNNAALTDGAASDDIDILAVPVP